MNVGDSRDQIARLGLLADPGRAALHRLIRASRDGVTRDEAATAVGISRSLAAFHLDRLAEAGLAEVAYQRRSGRSGPGAGRPAKVYKRSGETVSVSVPGRRYEVAASLFAAAISRHLAGDADVTDALDDTARAAGVALGAEARKRAGTRRSRSALLEAGCAVLDEAGFEPELDGRTLVLRNCPFDALVRDNRDLVCGMNRSLMLGVVAGLKVEGISAAFDPRPGRCCILWQST
jgi:predicted ArsR family transcriptional regulator